MQNAIIAIEDERYYDHGAIDIQGTIRALIKNTASDDVIQGGSSITQQLVKMTRLQNAGDDEAERKAVSDDSFARKFQELRYAVWVEDHLTKRQILERYLNTAYFGNGAYGIEVSRSPLLLHHGRQAQPVTQSALAGRARQEPDRLQPDHPSRPNALTRAIWSSPRWATST